MAAAEEDSSYVCQLDEASLKVALDELHEDPRERLGQVETFRKWILEQKHFTAPTDIKFLLKFLRTSKFSQLRAREILEGHLKVRMDCPEWIKDIDGADPKIHAFLRTGYMTPIPLRDARGRRIVIMNEGAFKPDHKVWSVDTLVKATMAVSYYMLMDENTMVNGLVFFEDMTHMTMKHMTFWGMDNMKKMTDMFEGKFPGRFKEFHYFNPGSFFEAMMGMMKPFLSKKMQDRFYVHGKNMEDIYKIIPEKYFPADYLPDNYKGEQQGTRQEMIEKMISDLKSPPIRDRILYETSSKWTYDVKAKPKAGEVPKESFRKLNID